MTTEQFRRLALSLPEANEQEHMGHPDFRVRGRIFATVAHPQDGWAMVKLTPEQQRAWVKAEPEVFVPVKGGWGRQGSTNIRLRVATKGKIWEALEAAWRNAAPKGLIAVERAPEK
jgi:hypothetical protein